MIKLWGRANSVNVQKVLWTLRELGVPFERTDAGGAFGVVNEPAYRDMNPNGLVPTIQDGDMILWESNAIVRYLAARYGKGEFYPRNLAVRADADRWMDWQTTTFNPAVGPAFWHLIRFAPDKKDPAVIENARASAEKHLAVLDAHLASNQYVTGDRFTMGDIPLGCSVDRWMKLPLARERRPHVERWYAALSARPGAQQVVRQALS